MAPFLNSIYYSALRPAVEAIADDLFPVNGYEAATLQATSARKTGLPASWLARLLLVNPGILYL